MPADYTPRDKYQYEFANVDYINNALTINTWYTPLASTDNVKVWYCIVEQTNNGAAAEDLDIEFTIDGTVKTLSGATMNSGTPYYIIMTNTGAVSFSASLRTVLAFDPDHSTPLETRRLQIRVRQVTGVDPVSAQIEVNVVYATLEKTYS